jgi:hypothetical protein
MKLIDKTPFYDEKGQISPMDRAKAILKFGKTWLDDVEAQKAVLPIFEKNLDRNYTLLRNVEIAELGISIPFILIGPVGVLVIYVTSINGVFRAKGDQWGTVVGNTFKPIKPNLLTRTEQMGRALQVYLQRNGYTELSSVEAILLCADPAVHVDSQRPVVRIVMRDALERFVLSIPQARTVLGSETAQSIIDLILNPPSPKEEVETSPEEPAQESEEESKPPETPRNVSAPVQSKTPTVPPSKLPPRPAQRRRSRLSTAQWVFLGAMFILWCLIMAVFLFFIVQDLLL